MSGDTATMVADAPRPGRDGLRLEGRNITVTFGGVAAVSEVDVGLGLGEILGLIGPNGAGKTTLVNALTGFQSMSSGTVEIGGQDVTAWPPRRRARNGLARTFQAVRLFMELTVFENVQAAALAVGERPKQSRESAARLLDLFALGEKAELAAKSLTYGEERRLGVARALATKPQFLLLDEPAAGLNEEETRVLGSELAVLPSEYECGLLVIEHDMSLIMTICQQIQVLNYGKTIALGTPEQVRHDPAVIEAYLGRHAEQA